MRNCKKPDFCFLRFIPAEVYKLKVFLRQLIANDEEGMHTLIWTSFTIFAEKEDKQNLFSMENGCSEMD